MTQFPPSQPPSGGWPPNPPEAGWHPDPTGRHQHRYWDGVQWTDHVADGGAESVDPFAQAPPQGGPSGGYAPMGGDPYAGGPPQMPTGPRPRSGPSPALLVGLGLLLIAVIAGVAFVLTQGDDDGDEGETTGSSTTTAADGSESGVVDAMATALEQNFNGQLNREDAECIAQGFLDAFGLERMAEVSQGGGDAFANLTPEEQTAATNAMLECVDVETLSEMGPGTTGG
jgi:hypothetical protein